MTATSPPSTVAQAGVAQAGPGLWAMRFFVLSDGFMFAALVAAYAVLRVQAPVWPPVDAPPLSLATAAGLSVLLVGASGAMLVARRAVRGGKARRARRLVALTAVLGGIFCAGQVAEFLSLSRAGLGFDDSLYASTFFVMTGFHGLHVVAGVVAAIAVAAVRSRGAADGADTDRTARSVAALELYWHFVDAVWIVLFTSLYLT